MSRRKELLGKWFVRLTTSAWIVSLTITGCNPKTATESTTEAPPTKVETTATEPTTKTIKATPVHVIQADAKYSVTFDQAAIMDDIPDGQNQPVDQTSAGKVTGLIRVQVEKIWSQISLTDSKGQPIPYVATLNTSEGDVEISLRSDLAPNHVRNFLALVKGAYYDGLHIDRVTHQEWEDNGMKKAVDVIKAGCPAGTWEDGIGHIGYWMKPEFSETVKHEEGTVGIWRDEHPESGACRFYITLGPAPVMDGSFTILGKVQKGMDVVRKIAGQPMQSGPESDKPVQPVEIKKITVSPEPVEKTTPIAHNNQKMFE